MNYSKTDKYSAEFRESGDCAVRALSIVCDVPYAVAHKTLAFFGRKHRGGTPPELTHKAMLALGYTFERVQTSAKTVNQLEKMRALKTGYYSVRTSGHRLAMKNGIVEDWTRGSKRRVLEVWRVTPNASRKDRKEYIKQIMEA